MGDETYGSERWEVPGGWVSDSPELWGLRPRPQWSASPARSEHSSGLSYDVSRQAQAYVEGVMNRSRDSKSARMRQEVERLREEFAAKFKTEGESLAKLQAAAEPDRGDRRALETLMRDMLRDQTWITFLNEPESPSADEQAVHEARHARDQGRTRSRGRSGTVRVRPQGQLEGGSNG